MISVEREGAVATVRYGNPPHDLMTATMLLEARKAFAELHRDDDVRVIVFTGAGPGRYCLNLDPAEGLQMAAQTPPLPRSLVQAGLPLVLHMARATGRIDRPDLAIPNGFLNHLLLFRGIEESPKITVAAIDGPAFGGGMELSLCFDLRIASDRPGIVLAQPEVLAGIVAGFGATQRMTRLVGQGAALDLMLCGRPLRVEEAARLGLVSRIFPHEGFDEAVASFAAALATRSPAAVAGIKRAVRAAHGPMRLDIELEEVWRTPEAHASLQAFRVKLMEALESDDPDPDALFADFGAV